MFDANTYLTLAQAGTKKYMLIQMINTDVTMTPSGNPTITLTLAKVVFTNWDKSDGNNEIIKQTFGFVGTFKDSD